MVNLSQVDYLLLAKDKNNFYFELIYVIQLDNVTPGLKRHINMILSQYPGIEPNRTAFQSHSTSLQPRGSRAHRHTLSLGIDYAGLALY